MKDIFRKIWKAETLRKRIIYVVALLIVFRLAAHIPVPGVNTEGLKSLFEGNAALGLYNIFSGGAFENFSIVMLGVGPYITSSIIFQLLTMIVPKFEEMQKEGEAGRKKLNQYQRLLAVPLALAQGYATMMLLKQSGANILGDFSSFQWAVALISIMAGTMFLMWIGELITEKGVGNGVSLLIFAGIISGIPSAVQQTIINFDAQEAVKILVFALLAVVTIAAVVFVTEGQRNIPVTYARQIRGAKTYGGANTHLPLRVNQAGVIPIIFAISFVVLPSVVAQYLSGVDIAWVANAGVFVVDLFNNQVFYSIFYFILVVTFAYFYTAVIFHPDQIAENLQKQGGFIPGVRPGKATMEYLHKVSNRILLAGALFLGAIAVLPFIIQAFTTSMQSMVIGGTSLLIVVSVVIETVKQIEAQLLLRDYDES